MADHHRKVAKPANSFMLFRSDFMRKNIPTAEQKDQGNVSKLAKEKWDYIKNHKPEEYEFWVRRAKQVALMHRAQNPDYVHQAPGRRVRDGQPLSMTLASEGASTPKKTRIQSSSSAIQLPPLAELYQNQQHLTPDSFSPRPAESDSCSTSQPSDDLLFDGEELEIEVGSYDSIVTMLDFHERGIKTFMSKIDEDFFY